MTVKQLIEKLKTLNQKGVVYTYDADCKKYKKVTGFTVDQNGKVLFYTDD